MRNLILLGSLCVLSACTGDDLDTPIKTCQSVTTSLLGTQLPENLQARKHETDKVQTVVLDFRLADKQKNMNVVCTYNLAPVGEDSDIALFGKFERTPSAVLINGKSTSRENLFNAINQATISAGKKAIKETNEAGAEMLNNAKETGTEMLQDAKETGKKIANDVNDFIQKQ